MPKVVRFHEVGGPEVLKFEEVPSPEPGKGEVRLKVEAIGLNRAESIFLETLDRVYQKSQAESSRLVHLKA